MNEDGNKNDELPSSVPVVLSQTPQGQVAVPGVGTQHTTAQPQFEQQQKQQQTPTIPDMRLDDIVDGTNERGIPTVRFIENILEFSLSFQPIPASAELLIGAYTELHTKYKASERNLIQKLEHLKIKVPELEKSLTLVQSLLKKKDNGIQTGIVRYNLADQLYGKAEIDYTANTVHLWLGANVMLEYTYEDAIAFLNDKYIRAKNELQTTKDDLATIRDQIVTCEVNISRIYNWDVRRKRSEAAAAAKTTTTIPSTTATISK